MCASPFFTFWRTFCAICVVWAIFSLYLMSTIRKDYLVHVSPPSPGHSWVDGNDEMLLLLFTTTLLMLTMMMIFTETYNLMDP